MASRFTETEKWNDAWFSGLKPLSKLLFLYLCDQCDVAGFLELNIRKICFDMGIGKQEAEKSLKEVETRLLYSKDNRFVFVVNFLKHQKNLKLNPSNNAHRGIIKRLEENLLLFGFEDINQFITSPSLAPYEPLDRGTGKGNGKGNDGDIGGMGEKEETWRTSFDIYKKSLRSEYKKLVKDVEFLQKMQRYHPGLDILLSLEKACVEYWSLEAGWKKKKASRSVEIDWVSTLSNALNLKSNQVYKEREYGNPKEAEQSTDAISRLHPALR